MKGFVIGKTLIPNSCNGKSEGEGDLFMYPQHASIKEVNKLASCMASMYLDAQV